MNLQEAMNALRYALEKPFAVGDTKLIIETSKAVVDAYKGQWRPIETAPKDGTMILVFRNVSIPEDRIREARWFTDDDPPYNRTCWYTHHYEWGWLQSNPPTHWMPLPDPPSEEAGR